ncbi:MAG TPA: hypothetical protein VMH83_13995, partial [Candidatus Acidoferrum sp.]|nr:hypothetical protein [Candidatus Acidoferrum sp.]
GADGKPRQLEIEAASLSTVLAFGLKREMLAAGTHVKVTAFGRLLDPDGANYKGLSVTLPDGSMHYLENTAVPQFFKDAVAAQALAGKWVPESSASFNEYMIAMTKARGVVVSEDRDAAVKGQAAVDDAGLAHASCTSLAKDAAIPFSIAAIYVLRTIEIGDKTVNINIDNDGVILKRVVHLDQTAHPANVTPGLLGHSIGHWEGQTLVIDTTGFSPLSFPLGVQSVRKHMIERLALTDNHLQLKYEVTVDDPDYYPTPFHYSMLWNHRPDLAMSGVACDDQIARKFRTIK